MGILLFELFRNPLFMGILNKWETLAYDFEILSLLERPKGLSRRCYTICLLPRPKATLKSLRFGSTTSAALREI